jgi:hypothetical protein
MALMMLTIAVPLCSLGAAMLGVGPGVSDADAANYEAVDQSNGLKGGLRAERAERIATDAELMHRIVDISYASLVAAAATDSLIPEQRYRITNFRTVHLIADSSEYHYGPIEPLIVKASTPDTLYNQALSEKYPYDIIYYSLENLKGTYGSETGHIFYREDIDLDIWAHQDWRNWVCRWWESVEGSGVFDSPRGGFAYRDFPMFNPEYLVRDGYTHIHIGGQNWSGEKNKLTTKVVFRGKATKVTMGGGTDPWIFLNPDAFITNVTIEDCSDGVVYAGMDTVSFGQNCYANRFYGDVTETSIGDGSRGNTFWKNLSSSMIGSGASYNTFEGNVHGSFIMPGISNQRFSADKVGEIIMMPLPNP